MLSLFLRSFITLKKKAEEDSPNKAHCNPDCLRHLFASLVSMSCIMAKIRLKFAIKWGGVIVFYLKFQVRKVSFKSFAIVKR